jgi:hypothetical protein
MAKGKEKAKPGPEPERVKLHGSWQKAIAEALKKPPMRKPKRKK